MIDRHRDGVCVRDQQEAGKATHGAKAKRGVVCPVTFGEALAQSNAAVTTNKAKITVSLSWRIVFIMLSPSFIGFV